MSFFGGIESFFKKVFTHAPSWTTTALGVLNLVAPEVEVVLTLVDPSVAAEVNPILTEVQADLGTASQLLKSGNTKNLDTVLESVKVNLQGVLTAGHIKDPESVQKATLLVNSIVASIESIESQIPKQ